MSISPQLANPIEVFCSYAEKDEVLREQLEKHLSLMKLQGLISLWYDRKLTAGTEKLPVIEEHLNNARIILLLISPDFMASDYLNSVELTRAMERAYCPGSARHSYFASSC